jgi:prophage DNA circulation protein
MFQAKIDEYSFEIKSDGVHDNYQKNVVEYDIPFSSGAIPDSLGMKSRSIRFTAIFKKENYISHQAFVSHALNDQVNTLVHPLYGPVKGMIKTLSVNNDERKSYCEIDIEFVEDAGAEAAPVYYPDVSHAIEETLAESQALSIEQLSSELASGLGSQSGVVLATELDSEKGILEQLTGLSIVQRNYLSKIESVVNMLDAAMIDISNPANSIIASIEFGQTLPGRVIGSIARATERYAEAARLITNSPRTFINSFRAGIEDLLSVSSPLSTYIRTTSAQIESMCVAKLFSEDETQRAVLTRVESNTVWGPDGKMKYVPEIPQVLTILDLEECLFMVRQDIQVAIDQVRSELGTPSIIQSLENMAEILLNHVNQIKLQREKIITIRVDNPIPVHLLCLQYGLSYMAAERVCAINDFWCPNFCQGEVRMYVR